MVLMFFFLSALHCGSTFTRLCANRFCVGHLLFDVLIVFVFVVIDIYSSECSSLLCLCDRHLYECDFADSRRQGATGASGLAGSSIISGDCAPTSVPLLACDDAHVNWLYFCAADGRVFTCTVNAAACFVTGAAVPCWSFVDDLEGPTGYVALVTS